MKHHYLKLRSAVMTAMISGLLVFVTGAAMGQSYNVTLGQQCNTSTTGGTEIMTFTNTPPAASTGNLTINYQGDLGTPSIEWLDIYDENNNLIGTVSTPSDCDSGVFNLTIPQATLSGWATSGNSVTFSATATSSVNNICGPSFNATFCVKASLSYSVITGPDDAGIMSVDSPAVFCSGAQNVVATLANFGTNNLTSATINWSANGVVQTPVNYTTPTLVPFGSGTPNTALINLGSYSFTGPTLIKVWTSNPNGVADTINGNDTVTVNLGPSLSGIYTIGGAAPDYPTFSAVVADLTSFGVCGPVTFHVRQGMYNEQISLGSYSGAATHHVTFTADPANTAPATLSFGPTVSASNYTLQFDNNAQNITFSDLEIQTTGTTYSTVIDLGSTMDVTLDNNVITGYPNATTSSSQSVVYNRSGASADSVTFSNNTILNGSYAFYFYGNSSSLLEYNNSIVNNDISGFYYRGIYTYYQEELDIIGNVWENNGQYSSPYLMQIYYTGNYRINKNDLRMFSTSSGYAAYLYYTNYYSPASAVAEFNNNFISVNGTATASVYGMYEYNGSNLDIAFNSISINTGSTASDAAYLYATSTTYSGKYFRNNNLANFVGGMALDASGSSFSSSYTVSNNNLYSTGSVISNNGGSSANIAQYFANTGDATTISVNPVFVDSVDLHARHVLLNGSALSLSYVTDDIDGDPRPAMTDIGADEFNPLSVDAGIMSVDSPGVVSCSIGNVYVTLFNNGNNTLTSVNVNWEVNGTPIASVPFTGLNLASGADTMVMVGNTTLAPGDVIKVFTDSPNGTSESALGAWNDTIVRTLSPFGLSGTYTLGGVAADYYSYSAVVSDMVSRGICGPVEILVNDSTYNEQIIIDPIPGTSAINTVTFRSASGDSTMSVLTTSANSSVANYTINFAGAEHVWFKGITISNTSATYMTVLQFDAGSNYNGVTNSIVTNPASTSTATSMTLVYAPSGGNSDYVTFDNVVFDGGSYGIYWYGMGAGSETSGLVVSNSEFRNQYYRPFYLYYNKDFKVANNIIDAYSTYTSTKYVMYLYSPYGEYEITGNVIADSSNSTGYIIYLSQANSDANSPGLIGNNFIYAGHTGSSDYHYGIYSTGSDNYRVYNNNFNLLGTSASNRSIYMTSSMGVEFLNNNFVGENGYGIYFSSGSIINSDHNNFYIPGGYAGYYSGAQTSLANWQSASGFDANGVSVDPNYYGISDLHVCNSALNGAGFPNLFAVDIDGDMRNSSNPDIGADEFIGSDPDLGPDIEVCTGVPVTLSLSGATNSSLSWSTGDTTASILTSAPGIYTVQATNACGGGIDSIEVSYKPDPASSFTHITSYLTGGFTNTSSNATSYLWDFGDGTTSTLADPVHIFANSGYHHVTLYATNECGTDSITIVILLEVTSVGENALGGSMNVYPNPTDGKFNLSLQDVKEGIYTIRITDLQGKVVSEAIETVSGVNWTQQTDLRGLSRGVYMLNIIGPDGSGTARIVID